MTAMASTKLKTQNSLYISFSTKDEDAFICGPSGSAFTSRNHRWQNHWCPYFQGLLEKQTKGHFSSYHANYISSDLAKKEIKYQVVGLVFPTEYS